MNYFPYKLKRNQLYSIEGQPCVFTSHGYGTRLNFEHAATGKPVEYLDDAGVVRPMDQDRFRTLLQNGQFFQMAERGQSPAKNKIAESHLTPAECEELDADSALRLATLRLLDRNGVMTGVKAISEGLAEHWTPELHTKYGEAPNPHTVKRWMRKRGKVGDRDAREAMSAQGRHCHDDDGIRMEIRQRLALTYYASKKSVTDINVLTNAEISRVNDGTSLEYEMPTEPLLPVSLSTTYRDIKMLECEQTVAARHGKQAAYSRWRGAGKGHEAERPLEFGLMDHTPIPAVLVIDVERAIILGRPTFSALVDGFSRVVLSHMLSFNAPSYATVSELLRRSVLPKIVPPIIKNKHPEAQDVCGLCSTYHVDGGMEFRSHDMESMSKATGATIRISGRKKPRERALVERIFLTIHNYVSSKVAGAHLPIALSREYDYDPAVDAVLTLDELEALIMFAIAVYHTPPHGGLNEKQPLLCWKQGTAQYGIVLPRDPRIFEKALLPKINSHRLTHAGIEWNGLRFGDYKAVPDLLADLVPLEGKRQRLKNATATVSFRYDPYDLRKIWVINRKTNQDVELYCQTAGYTDEPISLWMHEQIREKAKAEAADFNSREWRDACRAELLDAIDQLTPEAKERERKLLAKLYENKRIRSITGELASLQRERPEPVDIPIIYADVIEHEMHDADTLSRRPAPQKAAPTASKRRSNRQKAKAANAREATPEDMPERDRRAPAPPPTPDASTTDPEPRRERKKRSNDSSYF